ncbi:hypothetical protein CSIM01_01643 [Colletotrichum simmondsii]|uniref:Uncharacterized protein n=1 Tax=Colletotrichum simmondsii TaxID=703756 RepID=A0A135TRP4_9PEZI|nr:hypothetical protein CSIM01_01643 [Colletotrichum simmondsii]
MLNQPTLSAFVSFARSQSLKQTTFEPRTHLIDRALRSPSLPSSSVALGKLLTTSAPLPMPPLPRTGPGQRLGMASRLPSRWNPAVTLQRRGSPAPCYAVAWFE